MTDDEAKQWLHDRGWLTGDIGARLEWLVAEILREGAAQNLISAASRDVIWARHVVDSAQLLEAADVRADSTWMDIGSGAGFPGLVLACINPAPILLVEPRALRVTHLRHCADVLALRHCSVVHGHVEKVREAVAVDVITARAYAPLQKIFGTARHMAGLSTTWVLPKGRNVEMELASARQQWQGVFHVKQSVTDPESRIVVARGVAQIATAQSEQRRRIRGKQA